MITQGNIPSLARQARSGSFSIDLDDPSIVPPGAEPTPFQGRVKVTLEDGDFRCLIRTQSGFTIPEALSDFFRGGGSGPRMFGVEHCFRVTGTTPDGLNVELVHVWPTPSLTHAVGGASRTYEFNFNRITLPIPPRDPEAFAAQLRLLRGFFDDSEANEDGEASPDAADQSEQPGQPPESNLPSATQNRDDVLAIVPNVSLLLRREWISTSTTHPFFGESTNSNRSCFVADIFGGTVCLEEKDGDVLLIFRRESSSDAPPEMPAGRVMDGLLEALKFTHSCQPWPYYYERQENDRIVERWVGSSEACERGSLKPLSGSDFAMSGDGPNLFLRAAEYFAANSEGAQRASRALWLMHEACKAGTPGEIRLITLCSILEGLIQPLARRLLSAEEQHRDFPRIQKWQLIIERLNLPWTGVFEQVYQSWNYYRHPLAHGFQERSADTPTRYFQAYSRISAAIYILMAQEMGYRGNLAASLLEGGRFVSINPPQAH